MVHKSFIVCLALAFFTFNQDAKAVLVCESFDLDGAEVNLASGTVTFTNAMIAGFDVDITFQLTAAGAGELTQSGGGIGIDTPGFLNSPLGSDGEFTIETLVASGAIEQLDVGSITISQNSAPAYASTLLFDGWTGISGSAGLAATTIGPSMNIQPGIGLSGSLLTVNAKFSAVPEASSFAFFGVFGLALVGCGLKQKFGETIS